MASAGDIRGAINALQFACLKGMYVCVWVTTIIPCENLFQFELN